MRKLLWPYFAAIAFAQGITPVLASEADSAMGARAFQGAQWVMATRAARAVAQVGARAAAGDGPLGQKIRTRQKLETEIALLRAGLGEPGTTSADIIMLRAQAGMLASDLDQLDREIRAAFPDYADMANPKPLGIDELRALLDPQEALVLFLTGRSGTYIWAISPGGFAWARSDLTQTQLSDLIRRLRAGLDPTGLARAAVSLSSATPAPKRQAFQAGIAYQLYQELLAPVIHVLSQTSRIFVVKDGPLSSLPLAVLLSSPAPNDTSLDPDELRNAAWLMRKFAMTTLPGVSSLASIRAKKAAPKPVTGFVGFGNPRFARKDNVAPEQGQQSRAISAFFDDDGAKLDAVRALAQLPGTARELRRIARLFPTGKAHITLGIDATEAAVKTADLSQASIISFATHGLITGDISGLSEPALAFSPPDTASALDDGLLTASEASELNLNADWVILSACNTAAGDGTPGAEGLSGLARAFLFAGARAILVSHWPVRDDVAAFLTADTLQQMNDHPGIARSEALRRAMLNVLNDPSDPTLAHPSAWAPFVVVGEGGALDQTDP